MRDLLIALAFVGMVIAPAIVAANSRVGKHNSLEKQPSIDKQAS